MFFLVQENVFGVCLPINERYDLKGSTAGRYASRKELDKNHLAVRKDVDFIANGRSLIVKDFKDAQKFETILQCDIAWLRSTGLIDYSLLVGFVTKENARLQTDHTLHTIHRLQLIDTRVEGDNNMNYNAESPSKSDDCEFQYAYVGLVDILMRYSWAKWLENLVLDRFISGISCQPPNKYGDRLLNFVKMVLGSSSDTTEEISAKKKTRESWYVFVFLCMYV